MEVFFAPKNSKETCVPLFLNKTTICQWILHKADIGIMQTKDSLDLAGFSIYPKADTFLVEKHEKLFDTMCYTCYRCINQFLPPYDVFIRCDRLAPNLEDHSYTFEGLQGDTVYIAVITHNDSGPIRYMDTTLTSENKFRVFGKNEKIPGLNGARK
jgi:hypothetical protein